MSARGKAVHKDRTADDAIGKVGTTAHGDAMRQRAAARDQADRLRNERLAALRASQNDGDGPEAA